MSRRARILGASLVLEHVPDLIRYGSKPDRERARFAALRSKLRTREEASWSKVNVVSESLTARPCPTMEKEVEGDERACRKGGTQGWTPAMRGAR